MILPDLNLLLYAYNPTCPSTSVPVVGGSKY